MEQFKCKGVSIKTRETIEGFLVVDQSGACNIVNNYGTSYTWEEVDCDTVQHLIVPQNMEPVQQSLTQGKTPPSASRYAEIAAEMIALAESNKAQCYNHHNSKLREWAR